VKNFFTDHPRSIGESYFQHLFFATVFGLKMVVAGLACIIHAFLPFLFKNTGSNMLIGMMKTFVERMQEPDERIISIYKCIEKNKNLHGRNK